MDDTIWNCLLELQTHVREFDFGFLVLNRPITCDPKLIYTLWNKASVRAISDGGANQWFDFTNEYKSINFEKPDFISGDFDSIKPDTRHFFEKKGVKFIFTPDQDETDFTKALKCIGEHIETKNLKIDTIFVLCENSGRLDQTLGNLNTLHRSSSFLKGIRVLILSRYNITWVLNPGKHIIHIPDKFVKEEYSCGLLPLCGPTILTSSGLKWNLNKQISEFGGLVSTSNTYASNIVHITCDKNIVWTTQYGKI